MSSKTKSYIDHLVGIGEISFTIQKMQKEMGLTYKAAKRVLESLRKNKEIVSPAKGYYLILTPEFRALDCLPPNYFIDDLLSHWKKEYYVGLLSAAMFYGAAHHQPQNFQVMLSSARPRILCGGVTIDFIQNSSCMKTLTQRLKTPTGTLRISTPEATAMDLVKFIRQSGGINRVVTVLHELSESLEEKRLMELAHLFVESTWVQRLGYLLDRLGHDDLAQPLHEYLGAVKTRIVPLVPYLPIENAERDKKWKIVVNTKIGSNLDDIY